MITGVFKNFGKVMLVLNFLCATVQAAPTFKDAGGKSVESYLPDGLTFDSSVPKPEDILGYEVGTWHVRHDQLVNYMHAVAEASDRVTLEVTGYTHENRPLLLLTITAPENRGNLEQLRKAHIEVVENGKNESQNAPLFFYAGYSIHGNEPSGSNASLIAAYYLAAAQGPEIEKLLGENVVLLDPSYNPDGLARFAEWANSHKGKNLVADPNHREHKEEWPGSRTNHYWFDLNRDWLLLTHPESQARIQQIQKWRPHILTDHHEMYPNSTFFFQPGEPSRKNPNTPDGNVRLTEALAEFHALALDESKQLYFSEEGYDDFYYGKGSTYPDAIGSVAVLFEQASSRGHVQDTQNGKLPFAKTIQNQVTTTLSTLRGGVANKAAFLKYQRAFFDETKNAISNDETFGVVIDLPEDEGRVEALRSILNQHHIAFYYTAKSLEIKGKKYQSGSLVVPYDQPRYRLVKSLFSTRQSFAENIFYDVSNWNIGYAFDLSYALLNKRQGRSLTYAEETPKVTSPAPVNDGAYAYIFSWNDYYAPTMLQGLLADDVKVRSSEAGFTASLSDGTEKKFGAGSIVIPRPMEQPDNFVSLVNRASQLSGVQVYEMASGMTSAGSYVGSRRMLPLTEPKILVVGGEGTRYTEVGEVWHYLDTRVGMGPTLVELEKLANLDLDAYSHIIMVNGSYSHVSNTVNNHLTNWVEKGGVLIGQKSAVSYFAQQQWIDAEIVSKEKIDSVFPTDGLGFADKRKLAASKVIAGSVYQARIDPTHPIFFGYDEQQLPFFKTSNMIVRSDKDPFVTPARYTDSPLMAGYSAKVLETMIGDSSAVITATRGKGVVVALTDNVLFRGYWYGTGKIMANAIYQSVHLSR